MIPSRRIAPQSVRFTKVRVSQTKTTRTHSLERDGPLNQNKGIDFILNMSQNGKNSSEFSHGIFHQTDIFLPDIEETE
jgi:hypothetical protein